MRGIAKKLILGSSILLLFAFAAHAQPAAATAALPSRIRGYRVYELKRAEARPDIAVAVDKVRVVEISLTGVTLSLPVDVGPVDGGMGRVEFVSFSDFTVGGVAVEIEEYRKPFKIAAGTPVRLPDPVSVFVRSDRIALAAWKELTEDRPRWEIAGRVFVFGRFRKFGFTFKRVVPVDVRFTVANPINPR